MSKITIENWETCTLKRTKKLVFSCDDLRDNFEELSGMMDDEIVSFLEKTGGYVEGMHVKDAFIHLSEDEQDEDLGICDSGMDVIKEE